MAKDYSTRLTRGQKQILKLLNEIDAKGLVVFRAAYDKKGRAAVIIAPLSAKMLDDRLVDDSSKTFDTLIDAIGSVTPEKEMVVGGIPGIHAVTSWEPGQ